MRFAEALAASYEPARPARCSSAIATRSPSGYREAYSPRDGGRATSAIIEALSPERPLGVDFYHARLRTSKPCVGLKVWSHGRPIPLSERVPVLENMGFRVVDEQTFRSRRQTPDDPGIWLHDMVLERADGGRPISKRLESALEACFIVVMRGVAENDGYNALVMAAGLGWRDVALIRTVSRFLRQIRVPYSQDYMWATLAQARGARRARSSSCSTRASIRARQGSARRAASARRRSSPRSRTALGAVDSLDEDRIVRRFVNAVQSAIRTNYLSARQGRPAEAGNLDQVLQPQARRRAEARAALRNLRLFAALRGRAHALRQGGARRHPLVGPAAGLPHRNPRPGEGAAGQERGDRAGRLQGRLCAEAHAGRRHARGDRRPRASPPTSCSCSRCSTSPTTSTSRAWCRPRTWCATTTTIPISWSPPTRAPRPSPTSPTAFREEHGFWLGDAFASGGSAGYDHKGMGITARGAWESVKRHFREMDVDITTTDVHRGRRRRHVGRRVRQRHAARDDDEACRRVRSPRHLHRSRPRSGEELRRAQAHVRAAALELAGLRQEADLQGRRRLPALAEGDRAVARRRRRALGLAKAKATPQEVMNAILKAPVDLLFFGGIGTYIRASTRKRRGGRRPRQRSDPHHRQGRPRQGDRRGRQSRHDPARPHRGGAATACGSTPTRSTTRPASTPPTSRSTSRSR